MTLRPRGEKLERFCGSTLPPAGSHGVKNEPRRSIDTHLKEVWGGQRGRIVRKVVHNACGLQAIYPQ